MEGDHSENSLMTLARKWAQYIIRINANEGLAEKQLVKVFMNRMGEFYESKGIRLMETNEIDDFIHLIVEEPARRHHTDRETACQGQPHQPWQQRASNSFIILITEKIY